MLNGMDPHYTTPQLVQTHLFTRSLQLLHNTIISENTAIYFEELCKDRGRLQDVTIHLG